MPALLGELFPPLRTYCPILHSVSRQQALYLLLDDREVFYGGAAGGGKSAALLMAALQHVDTPGYAALILRRSYPQLSQPGMLIPLSQQWLGQTDAIWNGGRREWSFPTGAVIRFGHVEDESAVFNYQGGAYQLVGFDELTQFSETMYEYIAFSRARRETALEQAGVSVRIRATANPGGVGHQWVKARFVDQETREPGAVFIPAKVADNPGLDVADYSESLSHLGPILRGQLLDGDWGAFEGAAFSVTDDHLVDRFELVDAFDRFEAADYGLNGAPWSLVATDFEGNLVFADMLYVHDMLPSDLAALVVAKRKGGWGHGHPAVMDPSVWHRTGARNRWGQPAVLADEFTDHGVPLVAANNDPRAGLIRIRELLELDPDRPFPSWHPKAGASGSPRVFFHRTLCAQLVSELRAAQLQPIDKAEAGEKIDPVWESQYGHAAAMCRYAVMTRPAPSVEPVDETDDPRLALLQKVERNRTATVTVERFTR